MTQIMEKFHVLNELNDDFKQRIKGECQKWPNLVPNIFRY